MLLALLIASIINLGLIVLMAHRQQLFQRRLESKISSLQEHLERLNALTENRNSKSREESLFPLRVQAAERLIVLVERIKPAMLVHRHLAAALTASQMAQLMLQNIREEFEYNISQQLYVSERSWQLISAAREEIVQLIHLSLAGVGNEAAPEDLAREMFAAQLRFPDEALSSLRLELAARQ